MSIADPEGVRRGDEAPPPGGTPALDDVVGWLIDIADIEEFDPDADIGEQGVDSLDLIELAAFIEDAYQVDLDDAAVEEALELSTLRQIYDRIVGQPTARST